MPRLFAITSTAEIRKCYDAFETAMCKGEAINAKMGWRGASTHADVYWQPSLGIWSHFDPLWRNEGKKSNGGIFGISDPLTSSMNNLTLEINYDHDTPRKSVAGRFLKDSTGRFYIGHSGKIGGGQKGVGKETFLSFYPSRNIQTIEWGTNDYEDVIVLGAVGDPQLPAQIAAFVHQVAIFKESVKTGTIPSRTVVNDDPESPGFNPEFQGAKEYSKKKNKIVAQCNHGLVISRLAQEIEKLGYKVANDTARDLFIPLTGSDATILFEAKTDLTTTSIYTAIGQLMFHGVKQKPPPRRILVVPGLPEESTKKAIAMLGIEVLQYNLDAMGVRFIKLKDLLTRG